MTTRSATRTAQQLTITPSAANTTSLYNSSTNSTQHYPIVKTNNRGVTAILNNNTIAVTANTNAVTNAPNKYPVNAVSNLPSNNNVYASSANIMISNSISKNKRVLTTTPSEKSLTYLVQTETQGSHADISAKLDHNASGVSGGRRFTRKNNVNNGMISTQKQRVARIHTTINNQQQQSQTFFSPGPAINLSKTVTSPQPPLFGILPTTKTIKYCRDLRDSRVSEKQSHHHGLNDSRTLIKDNQEGNKQKQNRHRYTESCLSVRTGSFKIERGDLGRVGRFSDLDDQLRISEEKYSSRNSRNNRSNDSRCNQVKNPASSTPANINININVLKTELQLKQKQLQLLQEEKHRNRSLIEDLKKKQKSLVQKCSVVEKENKRINAANKELEGKIGKLEQCAKALEEGKAAVEGRLAEMQKMFRIQEKQYLQLQKKLLPKNIYQFQSCRQLSLQQSLSQLKVQLQKSKCQIQRQLQELLSQRQQQILELKSVNRSMEIKNRILQKRGADCQRYLEAYKAVKLELKDIKAELKEVLFEGDLLRKENVRLKRQLKDGKKGRKGEKGVERISSDRSLNLSLSTCSVREASDLPTRRKKLTDL